MRHREAVTHLPEFGSGTLSKDTEAALTEHAIRCSACRDWLATRELLRGELAPSSSGSNDHPTSRLLALCVIRPGEVYEVGEEDLFSHLERCRTCREDLEVVRAALAEAAPGTRPQWAPRAPGRLAGVDFRSSMQAALVVLLVGSALLLGGLFFGRHPLRDSSLLWGARLSQSAVTSNGAVEELTRHELDGKQVIKGGRRLVVSQVRVNPGADITFQAGEVVAFGDGFQVVQGARMTVGSDRSSRGSKEDRGRSGHR